MRGGSELDVPAAQPGELREAKTGPQRHDEQYVITTPAPRGEIGRGGEGVHLGAGEEGSGSALGLLAGDGQHLLDRLGMLGMTVGGEAEEGVDGREAGVAGGDAASSIVLEVIEETAEEHRVEIRECIWEGRFPAWVWA